MTTHQFTDAQLKALGITPEMLANLEAEDSQLNQLAHSTPVEGTPEQARDISPETNNPNPSAGELSLLIAGLTARVIWLEETVAKLAPMNRIASPAK